MNAVPNRSASAHVRGEPRALPSGSKKGARGRRSVEPRVAEGAPRPQGKTRVCVGCQKSVEVHQIRRATARLQGEPTSDPLVRLVAGPDGAIAVDAGEGAFGRGVYVHASPACVSVAAAKGLARSLKHAVTLDGAPVRAEALRAAIAAAYERRAHGLVGAARRAKAIAVGSDAVTVAARAGDAALIVVAVDAAQAAELTEVRRAVAEGRAIAWGTKSALSELVRGEAREAGIGVFCVTDTRLASAIRESLSVAFGLAASDARGSKDPGGGSDPLDGLEWNE